MENVFLPCRVQADQFDNERAVIIEFDGREITAIVSKDNVEETGPGRGLLKVRLLAAGNDESLVAFLQPAFTSEPKFRIPSAFLRESSVKP